MEKSKYTNALIEESSPYLLQHAHNPVDWLPWGETARQKARDEKKLMLISVGYAACHWCHVMEHESFEDEKVAKLMNQHFVCIKVDREERPDVDQVYMEAVQMMRQQGGWPLNCFTTPDGKPVYGGTYFPKAQWINILQQLANLWQENPAEIISYGEKLVAGMALTGGIPLANGKNHIFGFEPLHASVKAWKKRFDPEWGGPDKAPKFPLPSNYAFLMHYGKIARNEEVSKHVELTLDRMARGGICDQVAGGFARYSTDKYWKAPHFEKMLYDNAQLLSLYAEAYTAFDKREYLEVVRGIKSWLRRDMRHASGGYYSAVDADSEGVEGLYYTWEALVLSSHPEYSRFYHTDENALWEERLIPVRKTGFAEKAKAEGKSETEIIKEWNALNEKLLAERQKRIPPQTDDKILCSWNAMLAAGFATSYIHTRAASDLDEARTIMGFIETQMSQPDSGGLYRSWKNGKARIDAFLEDYAFVIDAYIKLYQADFDEAWLQKAKSKTLYVIDHFYDESRGLFFFTSNQSVDLITRPFELSDNVIPASNSVMAHNLDTLASFFGLSHFREKADRLLRAIEPSLVEYGAGYSHWADLQLKRAIGSPEVVSTGPHAHETTETIQGKYFPLTTYAFSDKESKLDLFQNRFQKDKTATYICRHYSCQQPVYTAADAMKSLENIYSEV